MQTVGTRILPFYCELIFQIQNIGVNEQVKMWYVSVSTHYKWLMIENKNLLFNHRLKCTVIKLSGQTCHFKKQYCYSYILIQSAYLVLHKKRFGSVNSICDAVGLTKLLIPCNHNLLLPNKYVVIIIKSCFIEINSYL